MENVFARRKMINTVLTHYSDFLDELSVELKAGGREAEFPRVGSEAFRVLDEKLTDSELSVVLKIEGPLRGRFPGVENRIRELLRKEIAGSFLTRGS